MLVRIPPTGQRRSSLFLLDLLQLIQLLLVRQRRRLLLQLLNRVLAALQLLSVGLGLVSGQPSSLPDSLSSLFDPPPQDPRGKS